jgi:predicted glycoside hydrolase/deacetylase ChbG (UPF0249 family)
MINLPRAIDEIRFAQTDTPDLALGVHLTLTHGEPCCSSDEVPTLVDLSGQFPGYQDWLMSRDRIKAVEVEREFRAQIARFSAVHPTIDHLDSHHHIAVFPEVWPVFFELALEMDVAVRLPCPQSLLAGIPTGFLPTEVDNFACKVALDQLLKSDLPRTDFFRVDFFGSNIKVEDLLEILDDLPGGTSELMCHPGYVDAELHSSSYCKERELELQTLTDPRIREHIEQESIEIVNFRAL